MKALRKKKESANDVTYCNILWQDRNYLLISRDYKKNRILDILHFYVNKGEERDSVEHTAASVLLVCVLGVRHRGKVCSRTHDRRWDISHSGASSTFPLSLKVLMLWHSFAYHHLFCQRFKNWWLYRPLFKVQAKNNLSHRQFNLMLSLPHKNIK